MYHKYLETFFVWLVWMKIDIKADDISPRIFGGMDAITGEFPWMIAIWWKNPVKQIYQITCGGSIIKRQWVLTAAHCLKYESNYYYVQIGKTNLNAVEKFENKIDFSKYILHPEFDSKLMMNDIALIKLREMIEFNPYVFPIPLSKPGEIFPNMDCIVTGWGLNDFKQVTANGVIVHPILQRVTVPILEEKKCSQSPHYICAGGFPEGGKGACFGDYGGPLQCLIEGKYHQVGLVSQSKPCALPYSPDVYTSISYYYNWIIEAISRDIPI